MATYGDKPLGRNKDSRLIQNVFSSLVSFLPFPSFISFFLSFLPSCFLFPFLPSFLPSRTHSVPEPKTRVKVAVFLFRAQPEP